ncbi:MAG TPA: amidohydrolase family protein [Candidatus Limnocylindrales bacterium]|nr:amidohydrolase family protein [Candidatus Limnocylindrales bacterium]
MSDRVQRLVLGGGAVFDGRGGDPAPADIAIENGRIVDIGSELDGDERVDVSDRTLLPGLFDCHVHLIFSHIDQWRLVQQPFSYQFYQAARNMADTLAVGITSVRDAGGADLGVKQAQQDGLIHGPRVQVSLTMISQTGGHGDDWYPSGIRVPLLAEHPGIPPAIVDGPGQMRQRVRQLVNYGADVIKVATSGGVLSPRDKPTHAHFRDEELRVLVEEAAAAGIWVMAHAQAAPGIKAAVRAGIRSIEHGIYLDDEAIQLMLDRGTWLVPTLIAPRGVIEAAEAGAAFPAAALDKAREVVDIHQAAFARAVAAGVKVAMGTDSGVTPHGKNLRELGLMAEGGMSPPAVLAATTSAAAELMGVADELGTLEVGKRADVVVVRGDPYAFEDLGARIEAVYQDGARVVG